MLTKPILGQGLHLRVSKRPRAEPAPVTRLPSRSARLGDGGHPQAGRARLSQHSAASPRARGLPAISLQQRRSSHVVAAGAGGGEGWRHLKQAPRRRRVWKRRARCLRALTGRGASRSERTPSGQQCASGHPTGKETCRPSPHRRTRVSAASLLTVTAFAGVRHVTER